MTNTDKTSAAAELRFLDLVEDGATETQLFAFLDEALLAEELTTVQYRRLEAAVEALS